MFIENYQPLITALPEGEHAFRSQRATWNRFNEIDPVAEILDGLFEENGEICISRADVRAIGQNHHYPELIVAAIIWGYPRGMRGNSALHIFEHIDEIAEHLAHLHDDGVPDWLQNWAALDFQGLGISTYTKFLHFLSVEVEGHQALILDGKICDVCGEAIFEELLPLLHLTYQNAPQNFVAYLNEMHELSGALNVEANQLEMFLFLLGLNLCENAA